MDINRFTPEGKLEKKHLISLTNYKEEEILEILHKTKDVERKLNAGEKLADLKGKFVCLITKHGFTRSRIAFETAVTRLSGSPVVCAVRGTELETMINDKLSMSAISGYGVNAVVVQTSEETDAEAMERGLDIPVINANAKSGPCEALAALYAIWQEKGTLSSLKVTMIGDPATFTENFANAFCACGLDVTFVCPESLTPDAASLAYCRQFGEVPVTDDLFEGLKGADVVYVSDGGLPAEFTLTKDALAVAKPSAIVLHVLPVAPDGILSEEVVSSPAFAGLTEAHALPLVETAILSLLVAKK